ncbi:MAG: hypothetical protein JM58_13575 [Peptococcaceae bacterium BICA1-8]|nr:MAG: hypothetical protein JM58_13575 [Peptococcaceae bacterium BICA1-8]
MLGVAYVLIITSVILKAYGLYLLAAKKDKSIEERKKSYRHLNLIANISLAVGVIILAIMWYM